MRVYLAARYSRRVELSAYRGDLQAIGIEVTSNWLDGPRQRAIAGKVLGERDEAVIEAGGDALEAIELRRLCAVQDVQDVRAADTFVTFTELPDARAGRGGRHVEFGLALAERKRLIVIGPVENVFHALGEVERFETWAEALAALTPLPEPDPAPEPEPPHVVDLMAALEASLAAVKARPTTGAA